MSKNIDRRHAKRILDRSEGTETRYGGTAHSRARHADGTTRDLVKRMKDGRKNMATAFLSQRDQNKAFSEAMQTDWGKQAVAALRQNRSGNQRFQNECKIVRNRNMTILVGEVVDRKEGTYMIYEAKLRAVYVVVEGDSNGRPKPVTVYPSNFYPIRQRQPVVSSWK